MLYKLTSPKSYAIVVKSNGQLPTMMHKFTSVTRQPKACGKHVATFSCIYVQIATKHIHWLFSEFLVLANFVSISHMEKVEDIHCD